MILIANILRWILGTLCTLGLILFSIFNRDIITIHLGPLEGTLSVPLYAIAAGFMVVGFLLGGIIVWLNHTPLRHTRRLQKKKIRNLERELENVHQAQPIVTTAEKIQNVLLTKH